VLLFVPPLTPQFCGEARNTSFIIFGLTRSVLFPQSTESEVSMATITLLMMYYNNSDNKIKQILERHNIMLSLLLFTAKIFFT
jgi:hypothetical protein